MIDSQGRDECEHCLAQNKVPCICYCCGLHTVGSTEMWRLKRLNDAPKE